MRYSMKKLVCFFLITVFCVFAQADTLERISKTHVINIGSRESSIPFSYLDSNHKVIGFSIDICNKIVDSLKRELKQPNLTINYVPIRPTM